jgi:ribose transport system ATP-binding protein
MNDGATHGQVLIRVRNVEKSYGATHVLKGVDFTVRSGEIHALLGGNGAGKSTLIRIVTGKVNKDAGEIVTASGRSSKSPVISVVHQELALLPDLTVAENISLVHSRGAFALARRTAGRELALQALRLIDRELAEKVIDKPARALSLHEGQIVEIARALSTGAEVLLLDEPTANLTAQETAILFSL